ncbi:MAG: tetratricopeptide repeat protein [Planctomycetota bacterium]
MVKRRAPDRAQQPERDPSDSQIDDIVAEFIERYDRGEAPREEDYFARYPERREALKLRFEMFRVYRAALGPLPGRGSSQARPVAPEHIGQFLVQEELGHGAMSIVYRAEDEATGKSVAIKVLPRLFALDPKSAARFRREAETIARLRHPNIVPVLGHGEDHGALYYVMEHIAGRTLRHYLHELAGRPVTDLTGATLGGTASRSYIDTVLRIGIAIAAALEHAHVFGIVHRDVKPSNIIIGADAHPYLVDFGLARVQGSLSISLPGEIVGTPYYMSPEQILGTPIDHATDIYALGVVLYEMLTLRVPHPGDSLKEVTRHIVEEPPESPRHHNPMVSEELEAVLGTALAPDRPARFQSAAAFAAAMSKLLVGEELASSIDRGLATFRISGVHIGSNRRQHAFDDLLYRANRWIERGRVEDGLAILNEAIELKPDDPRAFILRGVANLESSRIEEALKDFDRALVLAPHDPVIFLYRGYAHERLGEHGPAERDFERARESPPQTGLDHFFRGFYHYTRREYDQAIQHFSDAVSRDHRQLLAVLFRGRAHHLAHNYDEAERDFTTFCNLRPESGPAHHLTGVLHLNRGRFEDAERAFRTAAALDPTYAPTFNNLGILCREAGRYAEAEQHLKRALAIDPTLADAHCHLGLIYRARGQVRAALAAYRRALELRPRHGLSLQGIGAILSFSLGKQQRGTRFFRAAVEADPRALLPHLNLARLLAERGDPQAEREFKRAIELQPQSGAAHFAYGKFLERAGRSEEAEDAYRRSFDLRPDDPTPAYELTRLFALQGDERRALSWRERGDRILPSLPRLLADLAQVFLTSPAAVLHRPEKAVTYAMRAVDQSEGTNPAHLATLAAAMIATGKLQSAAEVLQRVLSLDFDDPTVAADVVRAATSLGRDGVRVEIPEPLEKIARRGLAAAPSQPDLPMPEPGP